MKNLYSTSGSQIYSSGNVQKAVRQAPTQSQLNTVIVNSFTPWNTENISIRFNQ